MSITFDPDIAIAKHTGDAMDLLFKAMSKPKPDKADRFFRCEPAHLNEQAGDNPPLAVQQVEPEPFDDRPIGYEFAEDEAVMQAESENPRRNWS